LTFGINFDRSINELDLKNVASITFGNNFSKRLCHTKLVKTLTLGYNYNTKMTDKMIGLHLAIINIRHHDQKKIFDNITDFKNAKIHVIGLDKH
jgi:hypothetical protein